MEGLRADDLEPVDEGFDAGVGVQMCVGDNFLLERDVMGCPTKEDVTGYIDHADKDGGIWIRGNRGYVQMIDCHIIVDVKRALRPKRRNRIVGEALMKASTIGFDSPV